MSAASYVYHTEILHPTVTTVYTLATYTPTAFLKDEYEVTVEEGQEFAFLTAKTTTGFTIEMTMPSPAEGVTVFLKFKKMIDPLEV